MIGGLERVVEIEQDFIGFLLDFKDLTLESKEDAPTNFAVDVLKDQDRLDRLELKVAYEGKNGYVPLFAVVFEKDGKSYRFANIANSEGALRAGEIHLKSEQGGAYKWVKIKDFSTVRLDKKNLKSHYERLHPYKAGLMEFTGYLTAATNDFLKNARQVDYDWAKKVDSPEVKILKAKLAYFKGLIQIFYEQKVKPYLPFLKASK